MRLLIDGRPLQTPSAHRGIGRYVGHIARAFSADEQYSFLFFRGADVPNSIAAKVLTPSPRRMITLSDSFFLPPLFRRHEVSAFHSTAFALPRRTRNVRYLLTVHDVTLLKFPHTSSRSQRLVSRRIIESAGRADMILPNSVTTAADLQEYVRVDPARMQVIYPMLDDRLTLSNAKKPLAALPGEYLLYVGGGDKTKNIETLLQAVSLLQIPLLIAGHIAGFRINELLSGMTRPDHRLVTFIGYVPDRQLAWLYQHATAFVFPSLNEGFGYPPLEALQCETPAVVSRAGALPETLENAALYVDDPLDPAEWSATIGRLLQDPELKKELLACGKKLLPKYSPATFKKNLQSAYFETG